MTRLGISKVLSIVGFVALLSSNMFGASLKGIELGEDLTSACEKLKVIYKNSKSANFKLNKAEHKCFSGFIGVEADKNDKVTSIELTTDAFGLSMLDGAKSIAEKYLNSSGAAVLSMDRYTRKGEGYILEYYQGKNITGKVQVTIDSSFIKLESILGVDQVNFK